MFVHIYNYVPNVALQNNSDCLAAPLRAPRQCELPPTARPLSTAGWQRYRRRILSDADIRIQALSAP